MVHYILACHVMSYYVTVHYVTSCHIKLCFMRSAVHGRPRSIAGSVAAEAFIYFVMLSYIILCYVMLVVLFTQGRSPGPQPRKRLRHAQCVADDAQACQARRQQAGRQEGPAALLQKPLDVRARGHQKLGMQTTLRYTSTLQMDIKGHGRLTLDHKRVSPRAWYLIRHVLLHRAGWVCTRALP